MVNGAFIISGREIRETWKNFGFRASWDRSASIGGVRFGAANNSKSQFFDSNYAKNKTEQTSPSALFVKKC